MRQTTTVGTPQTSAASRAATSVRTCWRGRDEHLAAEVAALLLGGELVLEVHAGGARLDHRLHQLERVQRPAEAGLGVGDDRRQPVGAVAALAVLDLVGAQERVVQAPDERGRGVGRIEALVGVGVPGEVRVGGDLPAGEVDRLQAGLDHLHGLAAGHRAERGDARLGVEEVPEPLGAEARERVLDLHGSAQLLDVRGGVRPFDPVPAVDARSVPVRAHAVLLSRRLFVVVVALAEVGAGALCGRGGRHRQRSWIRSRAISDPRTAKVAPDALNSRHLGSNIP